MKIKILKIVSKSIFELQKENLKKNIYIFSKKNIYIFEKNIYIFEKNIKKFEFENI